MGMAVFTDPLIDVTGLSRTELSMAYLLGTIGSSLFLTKAGQWYDRYGGRVYTDSKPLLRRYGHIHKFSRLFLFTGWRCLRTHVATTLA